MKTFLGLKAIYPELTIRDVAVELHPDGSTKITWLTEGYETPSDAEWEAASVVAEADYKRGRNRLREYPPIGDQLDALFHAGVFPPEMAAAIQAIKDKYPKGQE